MPEICWDETDPESGVISREWDRACIYFGVISGCLLTWHRVILDAARRFLQGCASWLCPYCGLMVAEGRQTTRNRNNQVAGDGRKSMSKAEFQSWETNVSKVRQYSRDGEWTGGHGGRKWWVVFCIFWGWVGVFWFYCWFVWGFLNSLQVLHLIHMVGYGPNWFWRQGFIQKLYLLKANGSGLLVVRAVGWQGIIILGSGAFTCEKTWLHLSFHCCMELGKREPSITASNEVKVK